MARVGIFGGSFNPPHKGHLLAAREQKRLLDLDLVLLIPAGIPPHKQLAEGSPSGEMRLAMTKALAAKEHYLEVSDMEIRREGASYTADTLQILHDAHPEDELFLLMGTDMFLSLHTWSRPELICKLASISLAVRRDPSAEEENRIHAQTMYLRESFGARIERVQNEVVDMSSTTVRRMLHFDCAGDYLTPEVLEMIRQYGLYNTGKDLKNLPFEELCHISLSLHKSARRPHVQGCSDTARALALHWGADPVLAARAGILHDITKAMDKKDHLALCRKYGVALRPFEVENDKLLHAKSGAAVARGVFGECEEVAEAIFWHTTGKADMTLLQKIIYMADYMEPNRDFPGVEVLREYAWSDLDRAMLVSFEMSVQMLEARGKAVDVNSREAMEFMQKQLSHRL